jgi:tetratricopeptide (TPR) repeat protein
MIPMLANIFGVTTDVLLGVDIDAKEKRINEILNEGNNHFFKHQYDEAEKSLRAGLKEYPNSHKLMDNLASTLSVSVSSYNSNWNEEEKKKIEEERKPIREEIIALDEKILAECTEDNLRYSSIQRLCRTYAAMGETEKAKSFANKLPNKSYSKENLMTETLKGTKKYVHIQDDVAKDIFSALNSIAFLIGCTLDDGTEPYNSDECIVLHHKIIDIINIFIEKGSFGDFNLMLVGAHHRLTNLYVEKNDIAAALNHFRLAAKHSIAFDSMPPLNTDSKEEYTSLLFKGIKFPFNMVCTPITAVESWLKRSSELDSVLPASELEEIREELRGKICAESPL